MRGHGLRSRAGGLMVCGSRFCGLGVHAHLPIAEGTTDEDMTEATGPGDAPP